MNKYILNIFCQILTFSLFILTGCEDERIEQDKSFITLSTNVIEASSTGDIYEVTVQSSENWTVSGLCKWARPLNESGASGETLAFKVDPSNSPEDRRAEFKVFAGSAVQTVTIISGWSYCIDVISGSEVILAPDATKILVRLDTNVPELTYKFSEDGDKWISLVKSQEIFGKTVLTFSVNANEKYYGRSSELTISGKGIDAKVLISQKQVDFIETDNTDIMYNSIEEGEMSFEVRSNVEFEIEGVPSWLTVKKEKTGSIAGNGLTPYRVTLHYGPSFALRSAELDFIKDGISLLKVNATQKNPNPMMTDITDAILRKLLVDKGWITEIDGGTTCEVLEEGYLATSLEIIVTEAFDENRNIKTIDGIGLLPSLKSLTLKNIRALQTINLPNCTTIEELELNKLHELTNINLGSAPISVFRFSGRHNDNYLYNPVTIASENLTEINLDFNEFGDGEYDFSYDMCSDLDVSGCPKLTVLKANREFNIWWTDCKLETIHVSEAQKAAIDAGTLIVEKSDMTKIVLK